MERLTGKQAQSLMEAVASVYEKKEDCVDKDKKTKHNCAKKVCHKEHGEGACIPGKHTLLEDGTVTHYIGAGKAVGGVVKKVLEPADNSPEAQRARMGARRPQTDLQKNVANKTAEVMKNSADLFDIVKGHFIDEGLTEEEALKKMITLTDEERSEIIEGSCGSKKDKKKKGGYGK